VRGWGCLEVEVLGSWGNTGVGVREGGVVVGYLGSA